jgi:hypothetical protein
MQYCTVTNGLQVVGIIWMTISRKHEPAKHQQGDCSYLYQIFT